MRLLRQEERAPLRADGRFFFGAVARAAIYHTYWAYARGLDMINVAYHYMDLVPKGRDEGPQGMGSWLHRYDEYPD